MRIDRVKFAAELARSDLRIGELAQLAGVNRATVGAVKAGKTCSEETAMKLATALGVPLSDLLQE